MIWSNSPILYIQLSFHKALLFIFFKKKVEKKEKNLLVKI